MKYYILLRGEWEPIVSPETLGHVLMSGLYKQVRLYNESLEFEGIGFY